MEQPHRRLEADAVHLRDGLCGFGVGGGGGGFEGRTVQDGVLEGVQGGREGEGHLSWQKDSKTL